MKMNKVILIITGFLVIGCSTNSVTESGNKHNEQITSNRSKISVPSLKLNDKNFKIKAFTPDGTVTYPVSSAEFSIGPGNSDYAVPDSTPELNLVTNLELKRKKMGDTPFPVKVQTKNSFSAKTCCGSGALHWGARIPNIPSPTNNTWGVYANHKINVGQTFSTQDTLIYSPTLMPPNYAPLEVTTVYYRPPGASYTQRVFGIWDHTRGKFIQYKGMDDSAWYNKYTVVLTDGRFYSTKILKTSPTSKTWTVQLYNYQTTTWENQSTDIGTLPQTFGANISAQATGWDFHEPKYDDLCPSLSTIKATDLQVINGTTWSYNTSANGGSLITGSLYCPTDTRVMQNNYYNWSIN